MSNHQRSTFAYIRHCLQFALLCTAAVLSAPFLSHAFPGIPHVLGDGTKVASHQGHPPRGRCPFVLISRIPRTLPTTTMPATQHDTDAITGLDPGGCQRASERRGKKPADAPKGNSQVSEAGRYAAIRPRFFFRTLPCFTSREYRMLRRGLTLDLINLYSRRIINETPVILISRFFCVFCFFHLRVQSNPF